MTAKLGGQEVDRFVAELGTRYEAYTRNKARDKTTGEEVIIPVSENAKFREELQRTIDELCAFYLTVSDEERDHIRKLVLACGSLHNGLLAHIGWTAQHKPPDWLWRGLAAASIEDNRSDFRDMFLALGGLYLEAVRTGIHVSEYFQKAAQLSSPVALPYFKVSMREFLASFEQSAYFKQDIQPKLPSKDSDAISKHDSVCPLCGEMSGVRPKLILIDEAWVPAPGKDERLKYYADLRVDDVQPQNVRQRPLEQFIDGFYCDRCRKGFVSEAILREGRRPYR